MKPRVAVIDAGSNSIKALVAEPDGGPHGLREVFEETLEVRISQGIGGEPPLLRADRIEAGAQAVAELWRHCHAHGPLQDFRIVATSALRSASNGHLFIGAVEVLTGCAPVVLTGAEEADGIALGVRTDPGIDPRLADFTLFDLGGGSLELIRFEHHGVTGRTSLPLGAVRLTEQFIRDPARPVPQAELQAIAGHVRKSIAATGLRVRAPLVGCSGGLAVLRELYARRHGLPFAGKAVLIERAYIEALGRLVPAQDLAQRIRDSGLPPGRADIFPAALTVFQVILELAGADGLLHSLHNLRYGLALRMLKGEPLGQ